MARLPRSIRVIAVGKLKIKWWRQAQEEYAARLKRYVKFEVVEVRDYVGKGMPDDDAMRKEGERLLAAVREGEYIILMTERGKGMTSTGFAGLLDVWLRRDNRDVVFLIGGPAGFSQAVIDAAREQIALSRMTFPHEMARVILTEQLYRAMTIMFGESYHK